MGIGPVRKSASGSTTRRIPKSTRMTSRAMNTRSGTCVWLR